MLRTRNAENWLTPSPDMADVIPRTNFNICKKKESKGKSFKYFWCCGGVQVSHRPSINFAFFGYIGDIITQPRLCNNSLLVRSVERYALHPTLLKSSDPDQRTEMTVTGVIARSV